MPWFRRRREPELPQSLVAAAQRVLAERGVETTIEGPVDDPQRVALRAADGQVFLLGNLVGTVGGAGPATRDDVLRRHFDAMLAARSDPDVEDLSPDELRQRVRLRLVADVGSDPADLSYARPFAPGVLAVLCVDFPTTVVTLSAGQVRRLPLGLDELFAIGQLNTDDERVEIAEVAPGLIVAEGESLFTASKAANLPAVVGALPHGAVIAVPNRHLLLVAPIRDASSLQAVNALAGALTQVLADPNRSPGGVVCDRLLFSRNGETSIVSSTDPETGTLRIEVDERFQAALEEVLA
ncbi:hypothetical protein Csp2054_01670 [Curtobacterium sp. 'Ferrero']|uniref:hypothetical protein n=1 Tax=Curtobacterium sp. 'Ferrero' TaxID=2033654 RepID=UPI000BCDC97A|nr:hypothetical protein [Curtobacterium sp. 'Ferrero']PCN49674.1 hypothetical protein Csp2054_01670 [Curtobacterium sp. 'Ferrero']